LHFTISNGAQATEIAASYKTRLAMTGKN